MNEIPNNNKNSNLAITITIIFLTLIFLLLGTASILILTQRFAPRSIKSILNRSNDCLEIINEKSINPLPKDKTPQNCKEAVDSLGDEYSTFFTKPEYDRFINSINNSYTGVGVAIEQIKIDETLTTIGITKVFDKTPAQANGIKEGDRILAVDGITTDNLKTDEVSKKIRGEEGTNVKLSIKQGELITEKDITRKKVEIPNIEVTKVDNIGVISIQSFSDNLYEELVNKTVDLRADETVNTIFLDLRSNGGGLLSSGVDLIGAFTPKNTVAVKEILKNDTKEQRTTRDPIFKDKKLIIIGDGGTASASEIAMITLKEKANALLIGKKTFGKGVVQELIPLDTGDSIKLTIAEWTSPNGYKINKIGIVPDKETDLKGKASDPELINFIKTL
jgi:carboxyl-terminal processing protease